MPMICLGLTDAQMLESRLVTQGNALFEVGLDASLFPDSQIQFPDTAKIIPCFIWVLLGPERDKSLVFRRIDGVPSRLQD
jgi:hypothetical protein